MPKRTQIPIERVRQLLAQGVKQQFVAKRLGINATSVCEIAARMKQEVRQ